MVGWSCVKYKNLKNASFKLKANRNPSQFPPTDMIPDARKYFLDIGQKNLATIIGLLLHINETFFFVQAQK